MHSPVKKVLVACLLVGSAFVPSAQATEIANVEILGVCAHSHGGGPHAHSPCH